MTQHVLGLVNIVAKFRLRQVPVFILIFSRKNSAVCQIYKGSYYPVTDVIDRIISMQTDKI